MDLACRCRSIDDRGGAHSKYGLVIVSAGVAYLTDGQSDGQNRRIVVAIIVPIDAAGVVSAVEGAVVLAIEIGIVVVIKPGAGRKCPERSATL